MEKNRITNRLDFNQEIIFSSSDKGISKKIAGVEKAGKLRCPAKERCISGRLFLSNA
jgi:hypothetical protein